MLDRLADGEATVGELGAPLAMSAPAVSKHLRVLEAAGLVQRTRMGRSHRIHLRPAPLRRARGWLERRVEHWESALDQLDHLLEEDLHGN